MQTTAPRNCNFPPFMVDGEEEELEDLEMFMKILNSKIFRYGIVRFKDEEIIVIIREIHLYRKW
jgi:hypothetical protein